MHIEQDFPDPLLNCLRLQRVIRGVKRSQGSPAAQRLPITDSLLLVIHRALDLKVFDHCAFWAACMLGYFGFLRAAEFTVPNLASFSPAIHLSVADIAVDSLQSPTCLRVRIKASKTDPFRQGCHIHIGLGRAPLCVEKKRRKRIRSVKAAHPYWFGKGTPLRCSRFAGIPLRTRKCLWPLVPSRKWSTSVSRNLDRLAAANFLYRGD